MSLCVRLGFFLVFVSCSLYAQITLDHGQNNLVTACCLSPDGSKIITAASDNVVRVWDRETGACTKEIVFERAVRTIHARPVPEQYLCFGGENNSLIIDVGRGKIAPHFFSEISLVSTMQELRLPQEGGLVDRVFFRIDKQYCVIFPDNSTTLQIWSFEELEEQFLVEAFAALDAE